MHFLNRTCETWEYSIDRCNAESLIDTIGRVIHKGNLESKDIYTLNKYRGKLKYYLSQYKYKYDNRLDSYTFSCKVHVLMYDIASYLKNKLGIS